MSLLGTSLFVSHPKINLQMVYCLLPALSAGTEYIQDWSVASICLCRTDASDKPGVTQSSATALNVGCNFSEGE